MINKCRIFPPDIQGNRKATPMQYHAAAEGGITSADMGIFEQIRHVLREMPDMIFDANDRHWGARKNKVSCHLICRALTNHFDVWFRDGYFMSHYQHSWLLCRSGASIIDPYPVAGAAPFIVANSLASPWNKLYTRSNNFNVLFSRPAFQEQLEQTSRAMSETIKRLRLGPPLS